jgi:glucosamine-6-phosphate deaminase
MAHDAAVAGADRIRRALHERGEANVALAAGSSQAAMLGHLVREKLDWSGVTVFHLDEYVGIRATDMGSFRRFLKENFSDHVRLKAFHPIAGEKNPVTECRRLNKLIADLPIDVAFVGIGENGHLAFNDPPADLKTASPYLIVKLDRACRRQQVKEGWFGTVNEVPAKAISMSIRQIMNAEQIICTVPDKRKAKAVLAALEGDVSVEVPASVLQEHSRASVYLDPESAALLGPPQGPRVIEVSGLDQRLDFGALSQHFHLFVGGDFAKIPERAQADFARRALEAGAVTMTAWGRGSGGLELVFDNEGVAQGVRKGTEKTDNNVILTVSHKVEELDKALFWFLDSCSPAPEYVETCTSWVAVLVGNVPRREHLAEVLGDPGCFIDEYINADIPSDLS